MWVNLHTHSYFSFLRGLASPLELAEAAAARKMPAIALTDSGMLSGSIEFYDACRGVGVKPILGLEIPVQDTPGINGPTSQAAAISTPSSRQISGSLVLVAADLSGWTNLCRLSSLLQAGKDESISLAVLADHAEGLLCLSGGRRGPGAAALANGQNDEVLTFFEYLSNAFRDGFYLELQVWKGSYSTNDRRWCTGLLRLAGRLRLPVVAAVDVHYITPSAARLQQVVSAIRVNTALSKLPEEACALPGSYFLEEAELLEVLQSLPIDQPARLVQNSLEVSERCQVELPVGIRHYPAIELPDRGDPDDVLRYRAVQAAAELYGEQLSEITPRLEHELKIIAASGYSSLFLMMQEILDFARQDGVPFSSRGSAASSLVAHCLGITSPDPVRLNLYFERFLNPMRATPPDIDTDLCSRRRDRVIRFVYERYGQDRVAMVSTINRYRSRSALRAAAKAHGLPPEQIDRLLQKLPHRWYGPPGRDANSEEAYGELAREHPLEPYPAIFADAMALIGVPDHLSIHPGGVIIAPGRMTDLVPVQMAPKGILITQFDLGSIERLGMLKIDLLGIRGLTVLGDVAEAISLPTGQALFIDSSQCSGEPGQNEKSILRILEEIPASDPSTSDMIRSGRTIGCFQIESPGMRATLREIQARTIDDLMVALALYRPGPLSGGLKEAFVERFKTNSRLPGPARLDLPADYFLHPGLQAVLGETYGVILYQEQVLRIAHELAGFSLADADLLRRAMSHFDLDKQMEVLRDKFIEGIWQRSQVPEGTADKIWELMAAFAGYGFPKAHAASYAVIAWRGAWCKNHHPALFMAAVLANWGGYYSQRVYLTEARRLGLRLKPPHVNYSGQEFQVCCLAGQEVLFMGLGQVRGLTQRTSQRIITQRPFRSFMDFLTRVDPRLEEVRILVRVGAFEGFGSQPGLLRWLDKGRWQAGQLSLFDGISPVGSDGSQEEDWSLAEKVSAQEAILGASLAAHPLELANKEIAASGALSTVDAAARLGQFVRVAGMRQSWRRSRAPGEKAAYFMSLEDLEGMVDIIIPGEIYQKFRREFNGPGPYLIEGLIYINPNTGEPMIRANRVQLLRSPQAGFGREE